MFDHVGIVVANLEAARGFYAACLAALDIDLIEDHAQGPGAGWLVFGTHRRSPFLVIAAGRPAFWSDAHVAAASPAHLAFTAPSNAAVDAFHRAGLAHGGSNNGQPGPRSSSTPYYAAFLIDPDGNNVEAGYRGPTA